MPGVPLAVAADRINRSPQWLRDQIRKGHVRAQVQGAGSRIRFLIDESEVDRLVAELTPQPYVARNVATIASVSSTDDDLTVDAVVSAGLMGEVDRLRARNAELERQLREASQRAETFREMAALAIERDRQAHPDHERADQ